MTQPEALDLYQWYIFLALKMYIIWPIARIRALAAAYHCYQQAEHYRTQWEALNDVIS